MMPVTIQIALLTAMTVEDGRAENSSSTLCQSREVHKRKPFHADRVNTSHSRRVTRKEGLFMVGLWSKNSGVRQLADGLSLKF
jgi:hypothetical protein